MCNAASFIVCKGPKAYWSKVTESHTKIRKEHGLPENGIGEPVNVQVEISPIEEQYDAPLKDWVFRVDQDRLPKWWDADDAEKECRAELDKWAESKLVRSGEKRDVNEGDFIHAVMGGTVNAVRGGTVNAVWSGTVNAVMGGTVSFRIAFSCSLRGTLSVIINRIGKVAKCFVGTDKARTITDKD